MKAIITKSTLAAAAALVSSTVAANAAGPVDFGASPVGYYGAPASHGGYATGSCLTGDCGHAGCVGGDCRMNSVDRYDAGYDRFGHADRYRTTTYNAPRSTVGHYPSSANYNHTGYGQAGYGQTRPNVAPCPGGICPQTPTVSHTANYPSQIRAGGCMTGNCPTTSMPRYQNTRSPMFSFLGMRF